MLFEDIIKILSNPEHLGYIFQGFFNTLLITFISAAIGLVLGSLTDKEVNKQLEESGYTIKDINQNDQNGEYIITIVNKAGEESTVIVPKGQMESENFSKEDVVYLDEDGMLEQAYDKDDE